MRWRAVIVAALGAPLTTAGRAHAGTYQVVACNAPGGGGVHAGWALACPSGGRAGPDGAQLHTAPGAASTVPKGAGAAWTFRAPAGDVVTHVTAWRQGKAREGSQVAARAGSCRARGSPCPIPWRPPPGRA